MESRDPIRWLTIADVEHYYVHLATGFAIGAINSEAFRVAMEAFKFRDDADRYWTIGAESGEWYVMQGDRWVRGNPPAALLGPDIPLMPLPDDLLESAERDDLPERAVRMLCRSCGEELEPGGSFCSSCGARLT